MENSTRNCSAYLSVLVMNLNETVKLYRAVQLLLSWTSLSKLFVIVVTLRKALYFNLVCGVDGLQSPNKLLPRQA
jgi:hypothetical protein